MNPFNISLRHALAVIAENMLPAFSGQDKVLEVIIQMLYDKGRFQHVKVVFWRPNNYMLVGHDNETHVDDIPGNFAITANHDSTWKQDGLNFFGDILRDPKETIILSCKVIGIKNPTVNETEKMFRYEKLKNGMEVTE